MNQERQTTPQRVDPQLAVQFGLGLAQLLRVIPVLFLDLSHPPLHQGVDHLHAPHVADGSDVEGVEGKADHQRQEDDGQSIAGHDPVEKIQDRQHDVVGEKSDSEVHGGCWRTSVTHCKGFRPADEGVFRVEALQSARETWALAGLANPPLLPGETSQTISLPCRGRGAGRGGISVKKEGLLCPSLIVLVKLVALAAPLFWKQEALWMRIPFPCRRDYLTLTVAPASSSFFLISLASSLGIPSLTGLGAASTRSLASFRPKPVNSRTTLRTAIFLSAGTASRMTSKAVCSSTGSGAAAGAGAAAAATGAAMTMPPAGAAALTPKASSMAFTNSEASNKLNAFNSSRIF
ncbi:hypothetical protein CYA_1783 [Synechococcus sp. JA-3-3Ab]|nr:hypothetical protein CYA_1783 [Synechococcus sp. JA-3-3Ab]